MVVFGGSGGGVELRRCRGAARSFSSGGSGDGSDGDGAGNASGDWARQLDRSRPSLVSLSLTWGSSLCPSFCLTATDSEAATAASRAAAIHDNDDGGAGFMARRTAATDFTTETTMTTGTREDDDRPIFDGDSSFASSFPLSSRSPLSLSSIVGDDSSD